MMHAGMLVPRAPETLSDRLCSNSVPEPLERKPFVGRALWSRNSRVDWERGGTRGMQQGCPFSSLASLA